MKELNKIKILAFLIVALVVLIAVISVHALPVGVIIGMYVFVVLREILFKR